MLKENNLFLPYGTFSTIYKENGPIREIIRKKTITESFEAFCYNHMLDKRRTKLQDKKTTL